MIPRETYLQTLQMFREEPLIKVITGVRRVGKSTLLALYRQALLESGVPERQLITLNFEDESSEPLLDRHTLMDYLKERLVDGAMNYIFLDEIQKVPEFEILVDALYIKPNVDLYITGSNAYMLSGELATYLSGRYVEINVLPFSFKEFLQAFEETSDVNLRFDQYLHYSALPQAAQMIEHKPEAVNSYLRGVYESVMVKDVLARQEVRNRGNLERVLKFAMDNIGNLTSPNRTAELMRSGQDQSGVGFRPSQGNLATGREPSQNVPVAGRGFRQNTPAISHLTAGAGPSLSTDIKGSTVEKYLESLTESFVLYKAERWDVKGRKLLQTLEKYYTVDVGLRRILLGRREGGDLGRLLENVVYLELRRRGGEVYVGKAGEQEVDFVVKTAEGDVEYYQVAWTVAGEETMQRELRSLRAIKDNYPKTLLSLDPLSFDEAGIKHLNVISWLLRS